MLCQILLYGSTSTCHWNLQAENSGTPIKSYCWQDQQTYQLRHKSCPEYSIRWKCSGLFLYALLSLLCKVYIHILEIFENWKNFPLCIFFRFLSEGLMFKLCFWGFSEVKFSGAAMMLQYLCCVNNSSTYLCYCVMVGSPRMLCGLACLSDWIRTLSENIVGEADGYVLRGWPW